MQFVIPLLVLFIRVPSSFRARPARGSLSLACARESNPREHTPDAAPFGHLPLRSGGSGRVATEGGALASARRSALLRLLRVPIALRRQRSKRPAGCARGSRAFRCCTWTCNQRNPADDADLSGRMPDRRNSLGCISLLTFFVQAKKASRSPQASGSFFCKNNFKALHRKLQFPAPARIVRHRIRQFFLSVQS